MLKKRNREMHTHHVSIHAIWAICPQMAISDTFRHVPDTFLHVPRPWFTFRILPPPLPLPLLVTHWIIETTSSIYTFLHVPCYPSIGSLKSCPESIRSCTFCATLPIILCHLVLNLYVPIRSVQTSHNSVKLVYDLTRSITFRTHASCFLSDLMQN